MREMASGGRDGLGGASGGGGEGFSVERDGLGGASGGGGEGLSAVWGAAVREEGDACEGSAAATGGGGEDEGAGGDGATEPVAAWGALRQASHSTGAPSSAPSRMPSPTARRGEAPPAALGGMADVAGGCVLGVGECGGSIRGLSARMPLVWSTEAADGASRAGRGRVMASSGEVLQGDVAGGGGALERGGGSDSWSGGAGGGCWVEARNGGGSEPGSGGGGGRTAPKAVAAARASCFRASWCA